MTRDPVRWSWLALGLGVAAAAGCAAGWAVAPAQFYAAWLAAVVLWLGVSLGSLGLALIHDLTGGAWGEAIRPGLGAAIAALPGLSLGVVPVLVGVPTLYGWVHADHAITGWLTVPFFIGRALFYGACWSALAVLWRRRGGSLVPFAAPALILLALTASFAAIDWTMSLQHPWSSSVYGLIALSGALVEGLAFAVVVAALVPVTSGKARADRFRDLGSLLLALVLLWAYLAFMQYLIVWSENLADEVTFYTVRTRGGWGAVALAIVLLNVALPAPLLMWRRFKCTPALMGALALVVLVARLLHGWWLVLPGARDRGFHWLDPLAMLALGGCVVALVLRLARAPLPAAPARLRARERPA